MKRLLFKKIIIFIIPLLILTSFSLLNLYYAPNLSSLYNGFFSKQIIWYIICYFLFFLILFIKPNFLIKYSFYIYSFNVLLLLLVLFFGKEINGSKAWFNFGIFSFQPSEFMKISLILYLTKVTSSTLLNNNKQHILLLFKIILIFLIPAILTFLEPDTGAVIIYFFITLGIILFSKIKKKYIIILSVICLTLLSVMYITFLKKPEIIINIFGPKFYYRIDRITNFHNGGGMQIDNALITIGNAKMVNTPTKAINLYFPKAITDFIFTLTINNFGIISAMITLISYLFLDILIIHNIFSIKNYECKLITSSFLFMFLYHQIQNILMNLGVLPIIGIPLPFLSYGGSSLLLFFISLALILKLSLEKEKYSYRVFYR